MNDNTTKPVIVLDVDGILLDFSRGFADWFVETYPTICKENKFAPNYNPHLWNPTWPCDNRRERIEEFSELDMELPLLELDIPFLVQDLRKNYRVVLLTGYSNQKTRISNLKNLNIPYDQIIFVDPKDHSKKIEYVKELNPVCIFEDKPSTIDLYLKNGYTTYVPRFWNYVENIKDKSSPHLHYYTTLRDALSSYI